MPNPAHYTHTHSTPICNRAIIVVIMHSAWRMCEWNENRDTGRIRTPTFRCMRFILELHCIKKYQNRRCTICCLRVLCTYVCDVLCISVIRERFISMLQRFLCYCFDSFGVSALHFEIRARKIIISQHGIRTQLCGIEWENCTVYTQT